MLLLDTHVVLWLDSGLELDDAAVREIDQAAADSELFISPVSAWEIGLLVRKGRVSLDTAPDTWLERFLRLPGLRTTPLTPQIAIASSFLPEPLHSDPADRLLVATARAQNLTIVTRDRLLQNYASHGHVSCLPC